MNAGDISLCAQAWPASTASRRWLVGGLGWGLSIRLWLEDDIEAEPLESPHEPVSGPLGVQLVKVIAADLTILGSVSEHAESDEK